MSTVKRIIFVDEESIRRIEATVRFGGDFASVTEEGDIRFFKMGRNELPESEVGRGCGLEERNKQLVEIIRAGDNVQVQAFNLKKEKFVPVEIVAENGILNLRKLLKKSQQK